MDREVFHLLLYIVIISISSSHSILNSPTYTNIHIETTMNLKQGDVIGQVEEFDGHYGEVYHSIPYAEKPDNELRFEAPHPISSWSGTTWNATMLNHCFQQIMYDKEAENTSVDCLHLKVVIPLDANKKRYKEPLPVLFWIHGGSYQYLGKSLYNTSGVFTSFSSRKVIFVSAAYRLGMLGFLSLLESDLPGNYALRDLTLALQFIHDNANSIGADPRKISISGESAGAAAASILAVSPLTKDLIFTASSFSGSIFAPWAVRTKMTKNHSIMFIRKVGCERESIIEMKKCLQELPLDKLRKEERQFTKETETGMYEMYRMGCAAFTPVEDSFMNEYSVIPYDLAREGISKAVRIPVLISTTSNERLVATRELVNVEYAKQGKSILDFLPIIMSPEQKSLPEVVTAISNHYFDGNLTPQQSDFEKALTISQNGEQFASAHEEAVEYYRGGIDSYVIKADVRDGIKPTWHGMDVWILFDCFEMFKRSGFIDMNWSYERWRSLDPYKNRLADIITKFIYTGKIDGPVFSTKARSALKISVNGTTVIDADTDDYYFWKHTIPAIEALDNSSKVKQINEKLLCASPYRIPFFIATTLLIACMVACFILFTQRKRRLYRDRRQLRHPVE